MPSLILEFGSSRQGLDLVDVNTSIGRTPDNTIVVDHPTVSRVHAWFVREDDENAGDFFLRDTGSSNGTYIDGKRIAGKQPLRDGALIRVGPARMIFRLAPLAEVDPSLAIGKKPKYDPTGILFSCECGARLWVIRRRAGRTGSCPSCRKTLTYPIAQDLELAPENAVAVAVTPAPATKAADDSNVAIEICSICQSPLAAADERCSCPACGLHFHGDCWTENRGCSAYGCSQVNALAPKREEPAGPALGEMIGAPEVDEPDAPARFPWEFALLAASVLCTLIGLIAFGVPPLLVAVAAGVMTLRRRDDPVRRTGVVFACVGLALAGTIAGVMISSWWWFGSSVL